jgi:hypothetical protein
LVYLIYGFNHAILNVQRFLFQVLAASIVSSVASIIDRKQVAVGGWRAHVSAYLEEGAYIAS